MQHQSKDKPVRVTGEQRLHPALRKLGRACIALVRWQHDELAGATTPAASLARKDVAASTSQPSTITAPETDTTGETGGRP